MEAKGSLSLNLKIDLHTLTSFTLWCLQAKERKLVILRLEEDLKQAEGFLFFLFRVYNYISNLIYNIIYSFYLFIYLSVVILYFTRWFTVRFVPTKRLLQMLFL